MRDPHNHQSRGFGSITLQREDSAGVVLQNRYHDMLGKRVEVKSAVPRGQAPPPARPPALVAGLRLRPAPRRARPRRRRRVRLRRRLRRRARVRRRERQPPGFEPGVQRRRPRRSRRQPAGPPRHVRRRIRRRQARRRRRRRRAAHGWTEHTAPEGCVYYYNARSGVSQWERPMELDFPMSSN